MTPPSPSTSKEKDAGKPVEISERQRSIMRHALGLPDKGPVKGGCYRNYYYLYEGSTWFEECQDLVAKGLMTVQEKRPARIPMKEMGTGRTLWYETNGYAFSVTDAGVNFL